MRGCSASRLQHSFGLANVCQMCWGRLDTGRTILPLMVTAGATGGSGGISIVHGNSCMMGKFYWNQCWDCDRSPAPFYFFPLCFPWFCFPVSDCSLVFVWFLPLRTSKSCCYSPIWSSFSCSMCRGCLTPRDALTRSVLVCRHSVVPMGPSAH